MRLTHWNSGGGKGMQPVVPHFRSRSRQWLLFLLVLLVISVSRFSPSFAEEPSELLINSTVGEQPVALNPETTRWQSIQGQPAAFTLIDGKIGVFTFQNQALQESGFLESQNIITAYQLEDIDQDGVPEIIAGSADPGMVYVYKFQNGHWESLDYGKYVWSSITKIIVGNFSGTPGTDILIQNKEGYLFLFHKTEQSLDLIWKSPNAYRQIATALPVDLDNDGKAEIVVTYQNSGIAVLKLTNRSISTAWENYPWGKILAVSATDIDNDGHQEVLFSTSQKVVYILSCFEKRFRFKAQLTNYNYTIEQSAFLKIADQNYWVTTDTAGKLHVVKLAKAIKEWREIASYTIGRINQIAGLGSDRLLLWAVNQQVYYYGFYDATGFKLAHEGQFSALKPGLLFYANRLYLSPRSLAFPGGPVAINEDKNTVQYSTASNILEINKQSLSSVMLNGEPLVLADSNDLLIRNGEIYILVQSFEKYLNIPISVDLNQKIITLP